MPNNRRISTDELLSSWLHRLAYANGLAPKAFARVLGLNPGMWSAALDLRLPSDVASLLRARTGVSSDQLSAMTLSPALPKQLLLPLRNSGRRDGSTWLQFCSRCLADDAQPYFRQRWRLASRVSCTRHGCRLRDRCPSCRGHIAVFDQAELVPQHYCVACGYDLRRAPIPYLSPATRTLDQCIDDICSVEAMIDSPSGPGCGITVTGHRSETASRYRSRMLMTGARAVVIEGSRAAPNCAAARSARGAARRCWLC